MFKRGDIANNLFLICFTHMECILCGWGRIGYSDVSIHAPTRGATPTYRTPGPKTKFQSTHPHGVRQTIPSEPPSAKRFQSTHPHGVRHKLSCRYSDLAAVSIHAPTRGATGKRGTQASHQTVSIHAPTRGATKQGDNIPQSQYVSIHAPTRGATRAE